MWWSKVELGMGVIVRAMNAERVPPSLGSRERKESREGLREKGVERGGNCIEV